MYRKITTLILLNLFLINSYSQTASIVFDGGDNFQVTINQIKQHNHYSNSLKINNLKGDQPYNVRINFENDTAFLQRNIYLIDDGLTHIYIVSKKAIQLKKVVPAASYPKNNEQLTINYTINNNLPTDTLVTDTLAIDTAYKIPFASYYKLEDYEGRVGCPFPIKDLKQAKLRGIILSQSLEESKLEKVKEAVLNMDSACILVSQTKELIILFEFEETRLNFAKFMFLYTFDIDNYEKLYTAFKFENSKEELKALIKK